MKDLIRNVIATKNYELADMLKKIDTLWVQGSITEEERMELIDLARENANMQNSLDLVAKVEELNIRVKALEDALFKKSEEDTENGEEVTYDEYVAGKWYYMGDVTLFDGKVYKCIAPEGQVCTWSPTDYPAYWEEVND